MLTWHNLRKDRREDSLRVIIAFRTLSLLLVLSGVAGAANMVNLDIVRRGQTIPVDTLFANSTYEMRVLIENDYAILGMSLGFQVWSPDGAEWSWNNVGGLGATTGCVSVNPTGRLDPAIGSGSFETTGLLVYEQNIDEMYHDIILCGGVAGNYGIPTGPLEALYSYNFIPDIPGMHDSYTLCFDSCFAPPAGDFVFCDRFGRGAYPTVLWPHGGKCWTVVSSACRPGDANNDNQINVGDAVYLISYVFKGGPPPMPDDPCSGDANGDCECNVGDAVYIINYVFKSGPPPPDYDGWADICG